MTSRVPQLDTVDLDAALGRLFANDVATMADPVPIWDALLAHGAARHYGGNVIVSSFEATKLVLRDQARFSAEWLLRGTFIEQFRAKLSSVEADAFDELVAFERYFMRHNDEPEHGRLRSIVQRAFGPRPVGALRDTVVADANDLLDRVAHQDVVDLVEFAYELPLRVIGEMLDVPSHDQEMVHRWSGDFVGGMRAQGADLVIPGSRAIRSWSAYMSEIAKASAASGEPTPAVLRELIAARADGRLPDEGVAAICVNLLLGGHETTANLIGVGTAELLRRPDQWRKLCDDPSLVPNAVEELLRFTTPVQWEKRVSTGEMNIDGCTVEPDQTVFAMLAAANRDPLVFEEPNALDLTRLNASENLAFGFGIHHCIGAALARLEGVVAFGALPARFPEMTLVTDSLEWEGISDLRRLKSLPVRLGRESRAGT